MPRNFTSCMTGKEQPLRESWGAEWSLRRRQKMEAYCCGPTVSRHSSTCLETVYHWGSSKGCQHRGTCWYCLALVLHNCIFFRQLMLILIMLLRWFLDFILTHVLTLLLSTFSWNDAKILGIIFNCKLSFLPHIRHLKDKFTKALNLLRVVAHTTWGADQQTLIHLYRSLIRSKLDYGCVVYGSAPGSYLWCWSYPKSCTCLCLDA